MKYKIVAPIPLLQPYVKHFWFLDITEADIPFSQHILPYGWFELFFFLNGEKDDGVFTGQLSQSFSLNCSKPYKAVGISLQPWTGNSLFNIPANHFTDSSINLNDLDKNTRLSGQLFEAKNETEILELLGKYLLDKISTYQADNISSVIASTILNNPADYKKHKSIVSKTGLSRRRIEQRFLASTGNALSCR